MKVVILCGGLGTRLREETEFRPKPMVPVGERPILWHIMKIYAHYGFKEFILCLGYKGDVIKEYFRNYQWNTSDVTLRLGPRPQIGPHLLRIRRRFAGPQPDPGVRVAALLSLLHLPVNSDHLVLRTLPPAPDRADQETKNNPHL